jgi:hypothetical protein
VARDLGVTQIARWIKRHMPTPKAVSETGGLMNGEFPSVTFGSRAPGNNRQREKIVSAVHTRIRALKRRIELIASGYNKNLARGMRSQARSKRSGQGGNYAIS